MSETKSKKISSGQENPITPSKPPRGNILFVSNVCPNLNYEQIKQGLYALFSIHGPIYDITIKSKQNGKHFAFVDFPNIQDADKALEASQNNGKILQGLLLNVNYCQDPKKNDARKGQKCFICHSEGHKAKNCNVRPDLIKVKPKRTVKQFIDEIEQGQIESETNNVEEKIQSQDSQQSEEDFSSVGRDKDYLKFLKMKKRLMQKKFLENAKKRKKLNDQ